MDEARKRLLIELEDIVGHAFYNPNIQNRGPGGLLESEGRSIRYPISFLDKNRDSFKARHVDPTLPEVVITGCYKVGANELGIMRGLNRVVTHLERNYGLVLGDR